MEVVSRWLNEGRLTYIQVSERRRMISGSALLEFLNNRVVSPPKKRFDTNDNSFDDSDSCSLTTESGEITDVKSLEKEIERLCL